MRTNRVTFAILLFLFAYLAYPVAGQDLTAGKKLIETAQWGRAKAYFKNLLNSQPNDPQVKFYFAETLLGTGALDSAATYYQAGASADPALPFSVAGLGRVYLQKGDTLKAKETFDKAIKLNKKNVDLYAYIADGCVTAKYPSIASAYILRGKDVNLKNANLQLADGNLWRLKGNTGEAANSYERAYFFDKSCLLAYLKVGIIYYEAKNNDAAIENYKRVLSLDSLYSPAYRELGDVYYRRNEFADASAMYKQYFRLSETSIDDNYRFAYILFFNKEYNEATNVIKKLLVSDAKNPILLRLNSYISYELSDYKNSLDYMNKFFAVNDKNIKLLSSDYEYLAKSQARNGLDTLAAENFVKVFKMDSTQYTYLDSAARANIKAGKYAKAAQNYDMLTKVKPNDPFNFFNLGRQYYIIGKADTAIADTAIRKITLIKADSAFSKVAQLKADSHLGVLWQARTNSMLDKSLDKSKPFYEQAAQIIVNNGSKNKRELIECYQTLGIYFLNKAYSYKKENPAEFSTVKESSISYWKKVLELVPNDPTATQAISELEKLK
jgi:hypothetical protein